MKTLYPLKLFVLAAFAFSGIQVNAQLVDCNAFLKGNYVEVGINWNGAYGSSADAPTGYHPKGGSAVGNDSLCGGACGTIGKGLGFVADPDKDGWTVGTIPYFGDYFLPGSPQEGWSIQIDSFRADAWNQMGCGGSLMDPGLKGHNVLDTTIGSVRKAIWRGMFDSVEIIQVTTLDTTAIFFNVHVIFKNRSHTVRNNVYYLRTVDADNDEPETGSFTTKNKIEYQLPNPLNAVLVSSTGSSGAYLGLGTRDSIAKCFIIKSGLSPNKGVGTNGLDSMFGRFGGKGDTTAYQYKDSITADQGIGLVFKISTLNPVPTDSVIISYAYIFGGARRDVDSALSSTVAPWALDTSTQSNTGVSSLNTAGEDIKVFPNPFRNEITITGASAGDQVSVYDNMGRRLQQIFNIENDKSANTFHLPNVPVGLYIMVVTDRNGNIISKRPLQKQ